MREQRVALEHGVDVACLRRHPGHVLAVEPNGPAIGLVEARDQAQEGCLAASRWSQQAKKLARLDAETDFVYSDEITETSSDVADLEKRHRRALDKARILTRMICARRRAMAARCAGGDRAITRSQLDGDD